MYNNLLSFAVSDVNGNLDVAATLGAVRENLEACVQVQTQILGEIGAVVERQFDDLQPGARLPFQKLVKNVYEQVAATTTFSEPELRAALSVYVSSPRFAHHLGRKGGITRVQDQEPSKTEDEVSEQA